MRVRRKFVLAACLFTVGVVAATGVYATGLGNGGWELNRTDDPALLGVGRALFDDLPAVGGATRDPYGTACGMPEADYCVSAPTLSPDALIAAVGSALVARGANRERGECTEDALSGYLPDECYEVYSYRGVNVSISASDEFAAGQPVPTNLHGLVLRRTLSSVRAAVSLGSWESLGLTPAGWGALPCITPATGGCVTYKGELDGPGAAEEAHQFFRANLERTGYRVDVSGCDVDTTGATLCRLAASRFRSVGAKDDVLITAFFRGAHRGAPRFAAEMSVSAD